ncbi:transposase [Purpureocillium lavendulum]|uniref:Transposase n=1 Tax=Purpureocillium lavendulum TaxID=1247861 RepID=A0AB34FAG7_9HYPO|nr:transposase [Purpureocillium lavendulum]
MEYRDELRLWGVEGLKLLPAVLLAISLYSVLELNCTILATFRTWKSLYFWSLIVATNGIAPYAIGTLLMYILQTHTLALNVLLIAIGLVSMITGQSVVLYSRLHLLFCSEFCLRLILAMIILNAFILHVPTIVLLCGARINYNPNLIFAYGIYEKVQGAGFALQELIISGLYIKNALSFFSLRDCLNDNATRKVRNHLILVNTLIIILDITYVFLLAFLPYELETAFRPFVYSVKLKMELSILRNLGRLSREGRGARQSSHNGADSGVYLNSYDD